MVANHLVNSQEDITWVSDEPHKLAYQIQNGLALSAKAGIGTYGDLRELYRIRYKGDKVIAECKDKIIPVVNTFREMYDSLDIIGAVIKNKSTLSTLIVQNQSALNKQEQDILESYCKANEYNLFFHEATSDAEYFTIKIALQNASS